MEDTASVASLERRRSAQTSHCAADILGVEDARRRRLSEAFYTKRTVYILCKNELKFKKGNVKVYFNSTAY